MARATKPLLVGLVLWLASCAPSVDVRAERSRIATFPRYRTYAWTSGAVPARSPADTDAALANWRIRDAIDRALAAKGYVREEGAVSLLLDCEVTTRGKETDLAFQLIDARTREIAYRASASGEMGEPTDRRRLEQTIDRMLADLPAVTGTGTGGRV